jgi:hypothetical protein
MHKRGGPRNAFLPASVLVALIIVAGCTSAPPASSAQFPEDSFAGAAWKDAPLTDLQGRGNVSIGSFAGKTVIVPLLSVSCSPCIIQLTRQLAEAEELARNNPGHIVVVSLDIDPDTGPGFVEIYGDPAHSGNYAARSPQDLTMQIYRRFGPFAIDPGTIPVILVCPGGQDLLLPTGLKTAEALNETIAREC